MNLDTVRKCAELAASIRLASLGVVDADIVELLTELNAAEPTEVAQVEEQAEAVEAVEAQAAE